MRWQGRRCKQLMQEDEANPALTSGCGTLKSIPFLTTFVLKQPNGNVHTYAGKLSGGSRALRKAYVTMAVMPQM